MRTMLALLLALAVSSALSACVVAEPTQELWPCTTNQDCIEGYLCTSRAGDPQRSCVAACETNDDCPARAVCLPSGSCAYTCTFASDGTALAACPTGLSCGRLRYPLGAQADSTGLCSVALTCTNNMHCGEGARCASSDNTQLRGLSNLPCAPLATESGCPPGWIGSALGCLASCDESLASVSCPPATTCHRGSLVPVGARDSESGCYFGYYGAPCRDDSECFVGSCVEVAEGVRQCTETCEAATFISSQPRETACRTLLARSGPLGTRLVFGCASDAEDAPCVAHGGVGSGCGRDDDAACAEQLECRGGLCTRECFDHADCVLDDDGGNALASGYCDMNTGLCRRSLDVDSICDGDDQCTTGLCVPPVSPFGEYRCGEPRRASQPCTRDAECITGRCVGMRLGVRVCG